MSLAYDNDTDTGARHRSVVGGHLGRWAPDSAMAKLNVKQQAFVLNVIELPDEPGILIRAARAAGYGTATSSSRSLCTIASRLWNSKRVQDAYYEIGRGHLGKLAIRGLKGIEKVLDEGPTHKDFFKCAKTALQYGWPIETTQNINVVHRETVAFDPRLMERFSAEFGIPLERLLGTSRPQEDVNKLMNGSIKLIEATPVEMPVADGQSEGDDNGT